MPLRDSDRDTNDNTESNTSAPARLGYPDAIGILLLSVLLLSLSYFRSRHRMFWGDEIMGWLVLKQPDWKSLLHLWDAGIDSSGIWYYVFGRPWIALFGASEISLREYSAAGIAATAAILWIAARRFYSILPVAAAIGFVFATTSALRWQLANGRCYGLFLLANALVIFLLLRGLQPRGEDPNTARPSPLFLLATFAAYGLLAGSHILGILYVAAYLAMQLAFDLHSRRLRPSLYLAAIVPSFAVVLFSHANLRATMAAGKPTFWTSKPALRDFFQLNIVLDRHVVVALFLLFVLVFLRLRKNEQRTPIYLLAIGFGLLDALIFAYSRFTTSIYVDRYLLPFSLLAILLLCELFTQLREATAPFPRLRAASPALFLLLAAAYFFVPSLQRTWFPFPNYTDSLLAKLPPGLPVVDTDGASFVELEFYHHDQLGRCLLFPVDWQVALDPANPGGVSGFHEMDNFKATGLYAASIVPTAEILNQNRDFAVLTTQTPTLWLQRRILSDPRYSVVKFGNFQQDFTNLDIWLVHKR
jgi:hypothetical protein